MYGQSQGNKQWDLWQLMSDVLIPCVTWHSIASAELASLNILQCTELKFEPTQRGQAKYLCSHSKEFVSICLTVYCHHAAVSNQPLFRLTLIFSFKALRPNSNFICHQNYQLEILHSTRAVSLCVLYGSESKQRLFPYTTLTDWFL
jgi:hypothetical protein